MKKNLNSALLSVFILCEFLTTSASLSGAIKVENLKVEYSTTPIGIDIKNPRFSWQMVAEGDERGIKQSAYQIIVKNPAGEICWDSKKTADAASLAIMYSGNPLKAETRYTWNVSVWDKQGALSSASSWFETGLMNPDPGLSAWNGAQWIGGDANDLVFFSHYLVIFNLKYNIAVSQGSTRASFVFGANDTRLMDKNKNIFQVQTGENENYIKIELDISSVNSSDSGRAKH
jgi:alpha-L-rhamnosidase